MHMRYLLASVPFLPSTTTSVRATLVGVIRVPPEAREGARRHLEQMRGEQGTLEGPDGNPYKQSAAPSRHAPAPKPDRAGCPLPSSTRTRYNEVRP